MALHAKVAGRTRLAVRTYLETLSYHKAGAAIAEDPSIKKDHLTVLGKRHVNGTAATQIVREALRQEGLDAPFVAKKLKQLASAKKVQFFSHEGTVTDKRVTKDNTIRLKATELVGRYIGADVQLVELKHQGVLGLVPLDLSSMSDEQLTEIINGQACSTEKAQERQGVQRAQCRRARRVKRPA